jgi:hypothetical protein
MGKGFDKDIAAQLRREGYTKGLIAGQCAVDEVGKRLKDEFGKKSIHFSHDCCNVAEIINGLTKLSGVSTFDLLPTSPIKALGLFISAKLNGSKALLAKLF